MDECEVVLGMKSIALSECCRFSCGGTPSKANKDYWAGKIPWFSPKDIKSFELRGSQDHISQKAVDSSSTRLVLKGSIFVVTRSGVLAHSLPVGVTCVESAFNQDIKAIIPIDNDTDAEFIALFLKANESRIISDGVKLGATVHSLKSGFLEALRVPKLSLGNQRRIAARLKAQLTTIEEARNAAQAQVNEVESLAKASLREFESELQNTYKFSPFANWVQSYRNGFGKRPKPGETGSIVLRIADVSSGVIDLSDPRRGEVSFKEAETYCLVPGDLLFVRVNGTKRIVGRCCVVGDNIPHDTIFNDHLIRTQLKEGLLPSFARLCMSLPAARAAIEEAASTSAGQLTVNQSILDSIEIPVLSFDQQTVVVRQFEQRIALIDQIRTETWARLKEIEKLPSRLLAQAFDI